MPWVSISEAARHCGRKRQQLSRLINEKRLPRHLIDTSTGRTLVQLDGLPHAVSNAVRARADSPFLQQPTAEAVRARVQATPAAELPDIAESRQRNEHLKGELLELELAEKRGDLIPRARVEKEAFDTGRTIRDNLMLLPHRLSADLAATTDVVEVHRLLDGAIRQALSGLVEDLTIQVIDTREQANG